MKLSLEQVRHVASLSRLSLKPDEEETLRSELLRILEAVAVLDTLDTREVPATQQVNPVETPLRADEPGQPLSQADALKGAARVLNGAFALPRIIE